MTAVDPKLLRHARAARGYLIVTVALGLVVTGLIVTQAALLAHALSAASCSSPTSPTDSTRSTRSWCWTTAASPNKAATTSSATPTATTSRYGRAILNPPH